MTAFLFFLALALLAYAYLGFPILLLARSRLVQRPCRSENLEPTVKAWMEEHELPMKKVAQPARVAMTGRTRSPGLFEVMEVLGKPKTVERLRAAAELASSAVTPST